MMSNLNLNKNVKKTQKTKFLFGMIFVFPKKKRRFVLRDHSHVTSAFDVKNGSLWKQMLAFSLNVCIYTKRKEWVRSNS